MPPVDILDATVSVLVVVDRKSPTDGYHPTASNVECAGPGTADVEVDHVGPRRADAVDIGGPRRSGVLAHIAGLAVDRCPVRDVQRCVAVPTNEGTAVDIERRSGSVDGDFARRTGFVADPEEIVGGRPTRPPVTQSVPLAAIAD